MGRAPGREPRPAAPTLALLAGLVYAVAEFTRQTALPSPPGVPGDSGGSLFALVSLGLITAVFPALVASALPLRRGREWFCGTMAAWIFGAAGLWRAFDRAGLLLEHEEWTPARFLLPGLVLAGVAAAVVLPALRRWPRRLRVPAPALLALVLVATGLLGREMRLPAAPVGHASDGANVLLVTIDTLRRDALGVYGGPRDTPLDSLDAIAHEAWAVSSWTQPSMASLFSGVVPTGHGSDTSHGPDPAVSWWPESIAAGGAQTVAFVTNPYLRRRFGFDRGFGRFDHCEERPWLEPVARTVLAEWVQAWLNQRPDFDRADRVVQRAERWLSGADSDRPWFMWVHLLDPHLPYDLRGSAGADEPDVTPDWMASLDPVLEHGRFSALHEIRDGSLVLDEEQRVALRRLYQTEVDYAAAWTARLVRKALASSGDRELVWVVTSDHGEEFFEEGGFEHGHSLADPVLRVPLLADGLGDTPAAFRLVDLGAAILSASGNAAGFEPRRGTQLLDVDEALEPYAISAPPGPAPCGRPLLIAEGLLYGTERTRVALQDGRVYERVEPGGPITSVSVCDPAQPPGPEFPWRALDLWRERRTISPRGIEVDDDLRRQLRALGYVN